MTRTTTFSPRGSTVRGLASLCISCELLAGCAGSPTYSEANRLLEEGKTEVGLALLEQAVRENPSNAEYRIALRSRRALAVNRLVASGEAARRSRRLDEADAAYRQAQAIDPENAMARQGLDALAIDRRHRAIITDAEALVVAGTPSALVEAEARLRIVLTENPTNRDGLGLRSRIESKRAQTPAASVEPRLDATFRKPVSLDFRDVPLRTVFDFIAKMSGLNVFFDKDVRTDQKVTVLAKSTSVDDAVRLLMVTNQLERKVLNDNSILVFPNTTQKQREYQPLSVRVFYLVNADVKAVSGTIKSILKTRDVVIDERLGMIILRDTPEAIRMAERIVALQDLSDPEVLLEVEVLEIKRSRLLELGIQWPSQLSLQPLVLEGDVLTLARLRNLNSSTIEATTGSLTINARKEDQDANILANPRIRVRNKEKAKVLIGDRVPVITTTSTSTGFVSESVTYVDVGLKLEVEPAIYLDDDVAIKINLEVSSLVNQIVSKAGSLTYQIGTRGASTVLRLKDGETQILAGLISDEDRSSANKVPGLGELPVAGRLFGSHNDNAQRGEILLSITPRVVRSIRRANLSDAQFESGTEASVGAESLRLNDAVVGGSVRATSGGPVASPAAAAAPGPAGPPQRSLPPSVPANSTLPPTGATPLLRDGAAPMGSPATSLPSPTVSPNAAPSAPPSQQNSTSPIVPSDASVPSPAAPVATPSPLQPAVALGPPALAWQVPAQVKVGDQFDAVVNLRTQAGISGLPVSVSYDRDLLELVSASEGSFFSQNGGRATFSFRVDEGQGQVAVETGRQSGGVEDGGASGSGSVAVLRFRALKANSTPGVNPGAPVLRMLAAGVDPPTAAPIPLASDLLLRIVP